MIGTRLKHYEIVRKLGSGGMGDVYAARDANLGREVALKILPPQMARDAERLERFRREATAVASLDHPNIVTIFSIEQAIPEPPPETGSTVAGDPHPDGGESVHFITMQLVEGATLDHVIPRRGLPLRRFFELAIPLADAVASAHEKGITHRDLKPSNIMVTPEERVKVLDFGLAKLIESPAERRDSTRSDATQAATIAAAPITQEGKILGTAAYMSPEQAEGLPVDHRTDIFSLGIILYEMASGEAPFSGDSRISILSSVVNDQPAPVSEINRMAPRHLGRIISHSLEKDPRRRFQSALDLRNELEGLKKEVDSGELATDDRGRGISGGDQRGGMTSSDGSGDVHARRRNPGWAALAAVTVIVAASAGWYFFGRGAEVPGDEPPTRTASPGGVVMPISAVDERPSIAVLYFDNVSGDDDLDWLRTGLPEMLVTDLSQSRGIRVLTTDRVYGILADSRVVDAPAAEALDAVGNALGVDRVLLGSVLRAGDRIRIVARLQDVGSGEIVASETLDGDDEEDLFDLVDQLTRRVRATFTGLSTSGETDRDVTEVTTSSVAALRLWVEADRYMNLAEYDEARERLQRAVEIDPEFAMAYAKLAAISRNMGDPDAGDEYAEAALTHADHLTERERYYVEGTYYYGKFEQTQRAAEAFSRLLDFDPSSTAARNNLALALQRLGRDEEAIAHLEVLVDNDADFIGSWTNLAEAYSDQGRFDETEALMVRLASRRPESGAPYDQLADLYLRQGRYEDVEEAVQQALRRGFPLARRFQAGVGVLTRNWDLAEEVVGIGGLETEPSLRFGAIPYGRSDIALHQGDSRGALEILHAALAEVPESGTFTSWLQERISYVHEARGELAEAIRYTRLAIDDAPDSDTLYWELPLLGRLQAMNGQTNAARATAEQFEELTAGWPEALISRERTMLAAAIAAAEGEPRQAATLLELAAAELSASGSDDPPHCYVWFDLAVAHIAAGNDGAARPWLQRIVESTSERTGAPSEYVRALYLLGTIQAARGEDDNARANYELFLEHWGNGDLRRDDVEAARSWLAEH